MRKITSKERDNGMRYCTFCKPERVRAVFRSQGWGASKPIQFACEKHADLIEDGSPAQERGGSTKDSGRMTEADYQTWWRL